MKEWIKCSDKLPEVGKLFLFIDEKNTYCIGKYVYKKIFNHTSQTWVTTTDREFEIEHMSCGCCEEDFKPTHWIELPDPPSEGK